MERAPTRPPDRITLQDLKGGEIEVLMCNEGLIVKRGILRFDLPPGAGLTLLRWMLWHGLHGQWAPKPLPVEYPRPQNRDAADRDR